MLKIVNENFLKDYGIELPVVSVEEFRRDRAPEGEIYITTKRWVSNSVYQAKEGFYITKIIVDSNNPGWLTKTKQHFSSLDDLVIYLKTHYDL